MRRTFKAAVAVLGAGVSVFHPRMVFAADESSGHATKDRVNQTAPHEGTQKRMRASTPNRLRSSTHDGRLSPEDAGGSTFADRTAKSLDLIGDTPLHEAAERYPADALRVFMRRHHRTYTDESPEFPERLRIFTSNAEGIRKVNALIMKRKGEGAKLLGLNLRSDMVLTSEMKFGGERMDHYFHSPLPSEREAMLLWGVHAGAPGHLRSSTHDEMEPRSGEGEAPATCAAGSQKPASKQHATQELLLQDAGGSTFSDRMAKSLKLVGDTPLHEAAERYPADAFRVFMARNHRIYTEESPEFLEALKIFTINAQIIREENALTKEEEGDDAKLLELGCRADNMFIKRPRRLCTSMPDHLPSSSYGGTELQSGEGEAPGRRGGGAKKPASEQRAAQGLAPRDVGESAFADRTARSLKLVGDTPLHDAAERYPVDAFRVYIRRSHRTYTDESVEFPERLRIFTSNAKGIREGNARIKEEEGEGAELLGLNLRSDWVLTSEMKNGGGERMDHYFHPPGHTEREAMLLKGIHTRVPDHLCSSTHDGLELRSSGGSTFADRMAESLKLVGDTPVHEAAERYPADAFRVFVRKHHLSFTDDDLEFPERLKIFTINAQIVREENALIMEEEGDDAKLLELNCRAFDMLIERPKRACTGMPDHLRSSSHGGTELQSGEGEARAAYRGGAKKPASEQRAAQEFAFADRTARSLKLVGDTPIYEAAERYPVDALRVFIRKFHRTYTDESVEFPKRLRMFKLNGEYVRAANARRRDKKADGAQLLGINLLADDVVISEMKGGQRAGPYPGHSD